MLLGAFNDNLQVRGQRRYRTDGRPNWQWQCADHTNGQWNLDQCVFPFVLIVMRRMLPS